MNLYQKPTWLVRTLFSILAAILLFLGGLNLYRLAQRATDENLYVTAPAGVRIINITTGGASDRAGLKVGDVIAAVNGQAVKSAAEAQSFINRTEPGGVLHYTILRRGEYLAVDVKLARFGVRALYAMFVLTGLGFLVVGLFVVLYRPRQKAAPLFALCNFNFALLFLLTFGIPYLQPHLLRQIDLVVRLFSFSVVFCTFFSVPVAYHLSLYFPSPATPLLERRRIWLPFFYSFASILVILALLRVFPRAKFQWGPIGYFFITIVLMLGLKFWYRKQFPAVRKMQSRYLKWAGRIAGTIVVLLNLLPNVTGHRVPWLQYSVIGFIVVPVAFAYTVYKYRLFNIWIRVRRNVMYQLVNVGLWIVIIVLFVVGVNLIARIKAGFPVIQFTARSIEIMSTQDLIQPEKRMLAERVIMVVFGMTLGFVLWKLHKVVQKVIDRKFYRTIYDYKKVLNEFSPLIASNLNIPQLCRQMVDRLGDMMLLKQVGMVIWDEKGRPVSHSLSASNANLLIPGVLPKFKSTETKLIPIYELENPQPLEKSGYQYVLPLQLDGRVVGILYLGEKQSEDAYQSEDFEFYQALARQVVVAIEDAKLHQNLTEQERMRRELELARNIQVESLPQAIPEVSGLDIAATSLPAYEVGGDYYDFFEGQDNGSMTLLLGDVSGKGMSAALYMSKIQGIIRSLYSYHPNSLDLLVRTNELVCQNFDAKTFITLILAQFNPSQYRVRMIRAGHPPALWYRCAHKDLQAITSSGLGLGLTHREQFYPQLEEKVLQCQSGDFFVFYSDGLTDTLSSTEEMFGEQHLRDVILQRDFSNAKEIKDTILSYLDAFRGSQPLYDDVTLLVVRWM